MIVPDITPRWVAGLAVVRRSPPPVAVPWGLRVDVGRPRERTRHVLLRVDEAAVRAAGRQTEPVTRLKAFVPPDRLSRWLGPGWRPDGVEFLMTVPPRPVAPRVPEGYALTCEVDDGVAHVLVRTVDGEVVAAGYAAVTDAVAVFDRIETDSGHRRRGLGAAVMHALMYEVVSRGAREAVLGATEDGRSLYERLGWTVEAVMSGAVYEP